MKNLVKLYAIILIAFAFCSCGGDEDSDLSKESFKKTRFESVKVEPLRSRSNQASTNLFTKLSSEITNIDFTNEIDLKQPMKRLYHSGFVCGGVALGDFNSDGELDIFFVSGPGKNKLYLQKQDFKFEDASASSGIEGGDDWGAGVAAIDIDGDSDLDLYVCNYDSPNSLYINDGKGQFKESAKNYGLDIVDASLLPTFCDYDNDGDLDVYLLTNRYYRKGGRPAKPPFQKSADGKVVVLPEFQKYYGIKQKGPKSYDMDEIGRPDRLLRNDGNTFVDVSRNAGILREGHGLSATWWDYDGDGLMDIYVANDFADPDNLFRNNGDGTFTDKINDVLNYTPWFSMGADAGDINNDGKFDFVALDMAATTHYKSKMSMGEMGALRWVIEATKPRQVMRNCLYLNQGEGHFSENASLSGVANSDWSWAAKLADYDNDGRVDLFVSNGMARDFNNSDITFTPQDQIGKSEWDHYENAPTKPEQNLAFRNDGDLIFSDVSKDWGLDHTGMSYGTVHGDLDRDGDLDLVVVNLNEPVSIYRNESNSGHSVNVSLEGVDSNKYGIGAVVEIIAGELNHVRQMIPVSGYLSSNESILHFGLGDAKKIENLTVRWPDGTIQNFSDLPVDQHIRITHSKDRIQTKEDQPSAPMFALHSPLRGIFHQERSYEDFIHQPLLPNKLSQLGPGIAFADVDGNGTEDFFIGCPRGQSGAVFLSDGKGSFKVNGKGPPFDKHYDSEDIGALFLDADSDGDSDLYVSSGSYEYEKGDPLVRDRIYINDGSGNFIISKDGALPKNLDNGSVVCGADFDRDGDIDLFVGSRVVSGEYPTSPRSRLLINESVKGKSIRFVEASNTITGDLVNSGMVTSALWSDVNNDGWSDLIVTEEWGPIRVYVNDFGKFIERTEESGLSKMKGWWNSIMGADIDNDGDTDYAVGNAGQNTKYHTSPKKPIRIYYADYEGNGSKSIVEAKYENGVLLPVRGKSCSTSAIPSLGDKFKTFHKFASSSLSEIYSPSNLKDALVFEVNELSSGFLINDGKGHFQFKSMPNMVQNSPIFGIDFNDVNGDGFLDIYVVQNFSTPQFETPPFRGGLSQLMLGDGKGGFNPIDASESGLIVRGDGRGLVKTDLNGDGHPDYVVSINDGELLAFTRTTEESPPKKLILSGNIGNPLATGSRLLFSSSVSKKLLRVEEIYQGGGYLSQSTNSIYFDKKFNSVAIRWPDGKETKHSLKGDKRVFRISQGD
ncbi:MAG: hypothetical protein CMO46_04550 [Verrucomicrobiales bacterium]|nr:hypothetical protein [Verrucomicrobiales bacterium]